MPKQDVRLLAKNALQAIKKSNMVLEVNTAGLRKPIGELYPSRGLLEEAYALDIPITFSSDAHAVDQIGFSYDLATTLAKDVGYTKAATFEGRDRELINF
jgi:histidinol-phosphatase (PHP family)